MARAADTDIERASDRVRELLRALDNEGALQASDELLRSSHGHPAALVARASTFFQVGNVVEAARLFDQAYVESLHRFGGSLPPRLRWTTSGERNTLRAIHGRALCAFRLNYLDEAHVLASDELQRDPDDTQGARFILHDVESKRREAKRGQRR